MSSEYKIDPKYKNENQCLKSNISQLNLEKEKLEQNIKEKESVISKLNNSNEKLKSMLLLLGNSDHDSIPEGDESAELLKLGKKRCYMCNKIFSSSNISRHYKICEEDNEKFTPEALTQKIDKLKEENLALKTTIDSLVEKINIEEQNKVTPPVFEKQPEPKKQCLGCKQFITASNLAKHQKRCKFYKCPPSYQELQQRVIELESK